MAKEVHNITVTVFEKNEEKIQDHKDVFHFLLPVDFEKQKVDISIESVEGLNQKSIYIIRLKTRKNSHNRLLLDNVFSQLSEMDKKQISNQYLTRLNLEGYFISSTNSEYLLIYLSGYFPTMQRSKSVFSKPKVFEPVTSINSGSS